MNPVTLVIYHYTGGDELDKGVCQHRGELTNSCTLLRFRSHRSINHLAASALHDCSSRQELIHTAASQTHLGKHTVAVLRDDTATSDGLTLLFSVPLVDSGT